MPIEDVAELRRIAAGKVVKVLQRRWRAHLPDGRIPKLMLRQLVKRPRFLEMVEQQLRTGALPLPDLDFHPLVERRPDGTTRNLLQEELGDDPRLYVCTDCGDEIARSKGRCDACDHWRRTGVSAK